MAKQNEALTKAEGIINCSTQKAFGYKKLCKTLKIPREVAGNVKRKFKTHGTTANLSGCVKEQCFTEGNQTLEEQN